ncbi:hypothetical protein K439DRAFT_1620754 [Ramaria rubella]|nr:hypothetical protein K439DRAFT_1620754 [Ramaria rubella]
MSSAASSSDNKVSTDTLLHVKLPNCDVRLRIRSTCGREPIQVKIVPTVDGSVELTLYVPTTAPDKSPTISTPTTPLASASSSFSLAAPNDNDIIDPRLLLLQSKPKSDVSKPKSDKSQPKPAVSSSSKLADLVQKHPLDHSEDEDDMQSHPKAKHTHDKLVR